MTATPTPAPSPPAGRYGRPDSPRRRRVVRWSIIALAVAGVALTVWIGLGRAGTPVRWDEVGFRVDGPTSTELTFDVTKDADATATCRVQALSDRYAEVGVQTVTVGPAGTATQRVTATIPTAELAVSAVVVGCEPA
ncbi:DUF4307 domain-containing protein [Cellulomonas sp. Marseille-Q8402]